MMAKQTESNPWGLTGDEQQVMCYVFAMCRVSRARTARDLQGRCAAEEAFDSLIERGFLDKDEDCDEYDLSEDGIDALNRTYLR